MTDKTFDATAFLKAELQTVRGVLTLFQQFEMTPPAIATVEKWFQRGRIPGEWLALMLFMLEMRKGKPLSIKPYVTA